MNRSCQFLSITDHYTRRRENRILNQNTAFTKKVGLKWVYRTTLECLLGITGYFTRL